MNTRHTVIILAITCIASTGTLQALAPPRKFIFENLSGETVKLSFGNNEYILKPGDKKEGLRLLDDHEKNKNTFSISTSSEINQYMLLLIRHHDTQLSSRFQGPPYNFYLVLAPDFKIYARMIKTADRRSWEEEKNIDELNKIQPHCFPLEPIPKEVDLSEYFNKLKEEYWNTFYE